MILQKKRGFTLIELLVVVVIIAILAAVALPQYQKAARKAQAQEVFLAMDALDKALSAYYLTYGTYLDPDNPNSFREGGTPAEKLEILPPTLKHFYYATNGSATPAASHSFQVGYYELGEHQIYLTGMGYRIEMRWKNGKLIYKHCRYNDAKKGSCADLFPQCGPAEFVDVGSKAWWQSDCDL